MNEFLFDEKPFDIIRRDKASQDDSPTVTLPFITDFIKETGKIRVEILRLQKRMQIGGQQTGTQPQVMQGPVETAPDPNIPRILKYIDQILRDIRPIKSEITELKEKYEDKIVENNAKDIMPIMDSFHRVFEAMESMQSDEPGMKGWMDGIRQIHNSLVRWLRQHGFEEIECIGKMFDPKLHSAIGTTRDPEKPNGTIVRVEKRGFIRKGVPIRYPEVVVVKNDNPV